MNHLAPLHLVDPRALRTYCGSAYISSPAFGPTRLCSVCKARKEAHEETDQWSTVRRGDRLRDNRRSHADREGGIAAAAGGDPLTASVAVTS